MRVEAFLIVTLLSAISPRAVLCQGDSPSSRANDLQPRFASFETAPTGRFPYMCSLRFNADRSKHACGGILIHPSWILTAAHCVDPLAPGSPGLVPIVYCGIHDIADDSEDLVFATVDARDDKGVSPLHDAAKTDRIGIVRVLLRNGADVNATDDVNETPLHKAAWSGHARIAELLVEAGADVNAVDRKGETPLHDAAEYGQLDVVEVLLNAGASKTAEDNNGKKAEDVVCSQSSAQCSTSTRSDIKALLAT